MLLEERGNTFDDRNWMLNEALNARKLQTGGTFRKVLAKKLDAAIVPIFAGIIARIDRNYNLNLIHNEDPSITKFWLTIFANPQIMGFHFDEFVTGEQVPGIGGRKLEEDFECRLPFSWLIKEVFDDQWHSAKSTAGGLTILCIFMNQSVYIPPADHVIYTTLAVK